MKLHRVALDDMRAALREINIRFRNNVRFSGFERLWGNGEFPSGFQFVIVAEDREKPGARIAYTGRKTNFVCQHVMVGFLGELERKYQKNLSISEALKVIARFPDTAKCTCNN